MDGYSLERFFSAFSINDAGSDTGSSTENLSSTTVELNSDLSLPYQWEQRLDLRTGEIFYIDWRSGRKTRVDPRMLNFNAEGSHADGKSHNGEEEEEDAHYEGILEVSDNGGSSSSCSSTEDFVEEQAIHDDDPADVLVVAGCKFCLTYLMLPKNTDECPQCNSRLLHFSGPEINTLPI